ncbi:MAG: hypothetical protein AAFV01_14205, partial [Bacteroidota bacterium]
MLNADWNAIQSDIDAASHTMKGAIVARHAERLGCSVSTVYRNLKKVFGKKKESPKQSRIPDTLIHEIAKLKKRGIEMGMGGREPSTEICARILIEEGYPDAETLLTPSGAVALTAINVRYNDLGYRRVQPYRLIEVDFANQEHQMDWTRSKYWQVTDHDAESDDFLLTCSGRALSYKDEDGTKLRTWIIQLKDSYSRVRIARAYAASGESALVAMGFLRWVWTREEDEHPIKYLPHILKLDNGATAKRREFKRMCEELEIDLRTSAPYNSQSQGKVESGFRSLHRRFDMALALRMGAGATIWMRDYNALLHEHLVEDAGLRHPRQRCTRMHSYRSSLRAYPQREVDMDIVRLASRTERRRVAPSCMVDFDGEPFEAPARYAGEWIMVHRNMAGELVGEPLQGEGKPFTLRPYYFSGMDDYSHRPEDTPGTRAEKDALADLHRPWVQRAAPKVHYLPPDTEQVQPDT